MTSKKDVPLSLEAYDRQTLTRDLRYEWIDPPSARPHKTPILWDHSNAVFLDYLLNDLMEYEWRVDFIRSQIRRLGETPKGRRRSDLMKQFLEAFFSPQRIDESVRKLDEDARRLLPYALLNQSLLALYVQPVEKHLSTFGSVKTMPRSLIESGLALIYEEGTANIPFQLFDRLPPVSIEFPSEPEPETFVKAQDPQVLAMQIQQWLNLIQSGTYTLRARPHWTPPQVAYMNKQRVWPPLPEATLTLLNNPNFHGKLELCSPEPLPSQEALDAWSAHLAAPQTVVEFIYHTMLSAQVILQGSPITLDPAKVQEWMMLSPGRQMTLAYWLHNGFNLWADWWPLWRKGQMHVFWNYQNYWQITSVDHLLLVAHHRLYQALQEILVFLPHDVWLSVDKVVAFINNLFPTPNHLAINDIIVKSDGGWASFLRLALDAMLTGPLHFMGFVDVAPDLNEVTHFRLQNLQDIHWGRLNDVPTSETHLLSDEALRYEPAKELLVIALPASPEFLTFVQRWAKPLGFAANELRYRLDRERLHEAFESGETAETLIQDWSENCDADPLPEIVAWWRYWGERYGHVRLYPHQVALMTRDEFTMQEIQVALPALRDVMLGLITPRTALLDPDRADEVLSGLERQGYMPKEEA